MANAFAKVRPIEPLVVTADERAHLERQVRRYRVSRSLSDSCRIIPCFTDGLYSKVVAAGLGVHEHTIGSGTGAFSRIVSTGCSTKPAQVGRERSTTIRSLPIPMPTL